jgi:hypothetical protein
MTRIQRRIGLYYGFFTVIGCTVHILGSMLHNKEWLYFVPIAAGMAWGLGACADLYQENERRGRLLRDNKIDDA